jgi:hypothetical protein
MKIIIFLILIFTTNTSIGDNNTKLSSNNLHDKIKNEVIKNFKYQFDLIEKLHFPYKNNVFLAEVLLKDTNEKNIKIVKEKIETKIKNKKEIARYKQIIKNKKILTIIEFNKKTDDFEKIIDSIFPDSSKLDSIEITSAVLIKETYEKIEIKN